MKLFLEVVLIMTVCTVESSNSPDKSGNQDEANGLDSSETEQQLRERNVVIEHVPHESDYDIGQQPEKMEEQKQRKHKRSRCKARNACVVMGGFCVTNGTICGGRLVPEGCKGTNCQCCVPGNLEAKLQNLENELQFMKHNLTDDNVEINSELNSMKANIASSNAVIKSQLDSIRDYQGPGCPTGFFSAQGSIQCYKFFTDAALSWTSAQAKCQSEGLYLAKPSNALSLRKYIAQTYGSKLSWIGARGAGSYFRWVRDDQIISNSDSLWWPGNPGSQVTTSDCLRFESTTSYLSSHPLQPYDAMGCTGTNCPLCELIMN